MTNKKESPRIALLTSQVNYDHTYLMEMRAAEHAEFLGCEIVEKAYAPGAYDRASRTPIFRCASDAVAACSRSMSLNCLYV